MRPDRWEHSLTSTKTYDDPYGEITIKVSYRGPRQQEISGLGFWDGGNTSSCVPCSQRQGVGLGKPRAPIQTTPVSISKPAQWKSCLIRGSTRFIDTGDFRQPVQEPARTPTRHNPECQPNRVASDQTTAAKHFDPRPKDAKAQQ